MGKIININRINDCVWAEEIKKTGRMMINTNYIVSVEPSYTPVKADGIVEINGIRQYKTLKWHARIRYDLFCGKAKPETIEVLETYDEIMKMIKE